MKKRTASVISYLKDAQGEPTLQELAQKFNVSQRTIRYDLDEINGILRNNQRQEITLKSGGRLVLPEDYGQFVPQLLSGDFYDYKLSKEERKKMAAVMIVMADDYITLGAIADSLFVSRATIINDLKDVKSFVAENGLEVISQANKGLRAEGTESQRRLFLQKMLESSDPNGQMRRLLEKQISHGADERFIIQKIITEQEHIFDNYLTDASYQQILTYLEIMVERNSLGIFLEEQPYQHDSAKYQMAKAIVDLIAQYCTVIAGEDDYRLLSTMLGNVRFLKETEHINDALKVQMLTRQFITSVSKDLGTNLNDDYDFFEILSRHIESVFSRPPADYPELGIIEEVLEDNQEVMEAVENEIHVIAPFAGREINEMEKAYVAIHVCAAMERKKNKEMDLHVIVSCHSGLATARFLCEKLRQHFDFRIVDIISSHEAGTVDANMADFIVSTVNLPDAKVPYVVVSPIFGEEDYIKVSQKIKEVQSGEPGVMHLEEDEISAKGLIDRIAPVVEEMVPDKAPELMKELRRIIRNYLRQSVDAETQIFTPMLHHLLPAENIQLGVEASDWRDAVRKSALPLLDRGYIEERYIDAMIANIEENGPYIVLSKGFAVPHEGLEQGSKRLGMNLIRLKEPVNFDADDLDPVEFVCCLSAVDHKQHLQAFFNLVNMLQNDEFKEMLRACETPEEIARVIEMYELKIA